MASAARNALAKTSAAASSAGHAAGRAVASTGRAASFAPTVVANAALSPTLTGLVLLLLIRGPRDVRARLVRALGADAEPRRLERVVGLLKVLFAVGVVRVANAVLNQWALRQWRWRRVERDGVGSWDFDGKKGVGEVVVVTGGCSGIGKEVVKGLAERGGVGVKVVVVDVAELPGEFEGRKSFSSVSSSRCFVGVGGGKGMASSGVIVVIGFGVLTMARSEYRLLRLRSHLPSVDP